ncbi:MAG: hypothetical protein QOH79_3845 [Acidimicrobiaceae bacterium]
MGTNAFEEALEARYREIFGRFRSADEYVGLEVGAAWSLAFESGVTHIRRFDAREQFGLRWEYLPERLNLLCADGVVMQAVWF